MELNFKNYKGSYFLIFLIIITFLCDHLIFGGNLFEIFSEKSFDNMTPSEYYKIFTAFLIHPNFLNLIANSIALFCVGRYIENIIGSKYFLLIFFLTNTLVFLMASIFFDGNSKMCGPSPGIYALTIITFILAFKHKNLIQFDFITFTGSFIVSYFILANILNVETFILHVGGMLIGIFLLLISYKKWLLV